ncbi:hypothetical protein PQ469_15620 [Mucilaginibacter sp. KACC 22773]|uniref:hypothetical protein n=1 Tax=Mucilaginibacter sp. KACC 22773 TaxID=3025671 RepID=UPI002365E75E|nr:hypothetical protein [Mucilaginibacter sp. KACC 22773]WDF75319.1 hypothetical protein PQ469_15620 [Mucilaginibacter sp. KACC 22773]
MRFKQHFKKTRLIFWAVVLATISGCFQIFGPGPATFVKKSINPSKTTQAILFWKGGNATSGNSLQVSVKDAGDDLDKEEMGNIFTVDNDHGKAWLNPNAIRLIWTSDRQLNIEYDVNLRTFIQVKRFNDDTIVYRTFKPVIPTNHMD